MICFMSKKKFTTVGEAVELDEVDGDFINNMIDEIKKPVDPENGSARKAEFHIHQLRTADESLKDSG